ncbi:GAF domain-containing protein [bacterium]|nr:GAF domain-containing protein [bacterium]
MKTRNLVSYLLSLILVLAIFFAIQFALKPYTANASLLYVIQVIAIALTLILFPIFKRVIDSSIYRIVYRDQMFAQLQLENLQNEVEHITHLLRLQRVLVRRIAELLKLDTAALFLYNKSTDNFEISDSIGLSQKDKRKIQFKESGGLVVWLKMEQKFINFPKVQKYERYRYLGREEKEKIKQLRAELCLPLILGDSIVGLLFLGSKKKKARFTNEDLLHLQGVADAAARAIKQATAQRDLSTLDREIVRYQSRVKSLENRITDYQRSYQNLMDYIKAGVLVFKFGTKTYTVDKDFKEQLLPDLQSRLEGVLVQIVASKSKPAAKPERKNTRKRSDDKADTVKKETPKKRNEDKPEPAKKETPQKRNVDKPEPVKKETPQKADNSDEKADAAENAEKES